MNNNGNLRWHFSKKIPILLTSKSIIIPLVKGAIANHFFQSCLDCEYILFLCSPRHIEHSIVVIGPVHTWHYHASWGIQSQGDSCEYRCECTQNALRTQWGPITQTTFGGSLGIWPLSFCSVCANISRPHWRTVYSTDILCISGSTYSKLALSMTFENFKKPIEIYTMSVWKLISITTLTYYVWQVNSTHYLYFLSVNPVIFNPESK